MLDLPAVVYPEDVFAVFLHDVCELCYDEFGGFYFVCLLLGGEVEWGAAF